MKILNNVYVLTGLMFLSLLCGCGYREGVVVKDNRSYFSFVGNMDGVSIWIDDNEVGGIENPLKNEQYLVSPGMHNLKIFRDNKLISERALFMENNITREIQIP